MPGGTAIGVAAAVIWQGQAHAFSQGTYGSIDLSAEPRAHAHPFPGGSRLLKHFHGECRRSRNDFGALPLPVWGEGWGEGVQDYRETLTPHSTPSPYGGVD